MFLSIFAATCRPQNITAFLDNLAQTADDPTSFEVLIKLDIGADELITILENYKKTSPLTIKYLCTEKLDGYYSLDVGYNELLKIAHPDTYFCWLLTDEIRLKTQGWDSILKKYIKFYPDDIFRIKLSIFQSKNYTDFFECLPCPDNYAVTTRKWLEITGGWGHFWGPDSWHQCIDYFLYLCRNKYNEFGIWRSFPIFDIKVGGQEAGQGIVDPVALQERSRKIWEGWQKHSTHEAQQNFYKLAQRLNAHIYACGLGITKYYLTENLVKKTLSLMDESGRHTHAAWSYKLPKLSLRLFIGHKKGTFFQLFPFAHKYKHRLDWYYQLIKKIHAVLTGSVYENVNRGSNDIRQFIYKIIALFSKYIEFFLAIPVILSRKLYHNVIKYFLPLPIKITQFIGRSLALPLALYQAFCKKVICIQTYLKNLFAKFELARFKKLLSRFRANQNKKNTNLYLFDGKYLKEVEKTELI